MRIRKNQLKGNYLIKHHILGTNISNIWQTVRRINSEIVGVKRLKR